MLHIEGISASYGSVEAIRDVSLTVPSDGVVCLLGANGAGKSTTLNCISGIVRPSRGRVMFEGQDITGWAASKIVEAGLVQVPEGREIFADLSVEDNLFLGTWTKRRKAIHEEGFEKIYTYFPRLKERRSQLAGTLSGGEQQMLMIGRALMVKPRLILLDEPSLGLSPVLVEQVFEIIGRIHSEKVGILLVEQNAKVALAASSYGYILENGELVHQGKATELSKDKRVYAAYLGSASDQPDEERASE